MTMTTAYTDGSGEALIEEIRLLGEEFDTLRAQHNDHVLEVGTNLDRLDAALARLDSRVDNLIEILERELPDRFTRGDFLICDGCETEPCCCAAGEFGPYPTDANEY